MNILVLVVLASLILSYLEMIIIFPYFIQGFDDTLFKWMQQSRLLLLMQI